MRVSSAAASYTSSSTPTLRQGSSGSAVTDLQRALAAAGFNPGPVDGSFGPRTAAAVTMFQRSRGLSVDGIVGPQTWGALRGARPAPAPSPAPSSGSHPTLKQGAKGGAVADMQRALARAGYSPGAADGDFGPNTAAAVRRFQSAHGLSVDGVVGPRTWAALGGDVFQPGPVGPVNPPPASGDLRSRILSIARGELGTREASNNNDGAVTKYPGLFGRGRESYCADFVSWVSTKAGAPLNYAYVPYLETHLKNVGKWKGQSNPQPGDLVIFDWNNDGTADHVGLVESVNANGSINTIEGNTGNPSNGQEGVWRRTRSMSDIVGFGNP